ncbi:hypothetical protein BN7_3893 [Wickerhamomyces ciferrii]|uniref:12 kDa heat shock protein n=1 Tax=Wickerhamomyces ciferrii (strain ATCC 14091 / BCRC 22168 / CBS 111 / JCM 3599 / NBRC 0793 / NRRL Y-1031 F-60-10) TaxID=1206466 RepID=K0KMZ6_WICCF|nr:uncharacterized protein BN7_3893 [Wickerhamomyces ciferrii]CCH44331.1 hypothetical protein BN7_3893 [Wickerhamomyces ciferrii]
MSDLGRKDFTDKAKEAVKPDDQKSYLEQAKEALTGKTDDLQKNFQPEDAKSATQKAGDFLQGGNKN